ncbi:tyrosine--tRNA ligase [Candidatus Peregrinibacteria bacterium]|nr:tyrosine--tRNA ligase [Candidatus Peregrinibacteria bacterium]
MSQKINPETILSKGVSEVIIKEDLEKKLKSGKKLRIKLGIDPSGANLHIGHMVVIKKLREFQMAGHQIILLFGNFTGQIGDPSDKLNARKPKTQKELGKNAEKYLEQVKKILDIKNIEVAWNADWLKKLSFSDIIKLAQTFTVHQMLERDMYQERIKKKHPIYMHEFLYPLMQGYDSVALKADVELGGTDQTFNLLAGREIQRAYNQEPQNVLTVPLLIGTDGKDKMGKSLDNYIGVNEKPKEIYGKTMSIADNLVIDYFKLATDISLEDIKKIKKSLKEGENPRNLKMRLAREIVTIYHNKKSAQEAEQEFIEIFSKKGKPEDVQLTKLKKTKWKITDLLAETQLVDSKGEARRTIQGGGVKIDDSKISSINEEVDITKERLIQVGKRKFLRVISK